MDTRIIAESIGVSVRKDGCVMVTPFEHFDGLTPDDARELAEAIRDAVDEARETYYRRQRTDAMRDLLDAMDAHPEFTLPHGLHLGYEPGFGQIFHADQYDRIREFLTLAFPNGDVTESSRLAHEDVAVYHAFKITTPRGSVLTVDFYDSRPESIESAQQERDAQAVTLV